MYRKYMVYLMYYPLLLCFSRFPCGILFQLIPEKGLN